ncbi:DUF2252 family protein [Collimonas fungivorans]|uniref:DUF2252 domain-containing protein n=1 Tax=Collimonas fungivorans (strain Ter331) TaxID=1005048 RepID=G0A866_COLFT|nr:DUF2252 family protein [Collimonas fungivorans]AEK60139.1 hypothetical protein CFU_0301 [Collimonas fungivorans Ter331]
MKIPEPGDRKKELTARRNQKMARSLHAYMRGTTAHYYEWLNGQRSDLLPRGPDIWICGDCHLGNLGPLANASGQVDVQIRDFDQAVIGNPAYDLVRLAMSLAAAARGSMLPGIVTVHMLEHLMEGYEQALIQRGKRTVVQKPEEIKTAVRGADQRSWKKMAKQQVIDAQPAIPLGKNFWPLSQDEKNSLATLFESREVLHLIATLRSHEDDGKPKILDAAYWVKGCSSLGPLRYAVLLQTKGEKPCLIDIKEAVRALAPHAEDAVMPRDNARRVLDGARHLSPALGKRMAPHHLAGHSVFVRELLPQDLKLDIDQLHKEDAITMARYLAYVVGRSHASQMDMATRKEWRRELGLDRRKSLAAPSWLWSCVVKLIAHQETGYLEHCRKYVSGAETRP